MTKRLCIAVTACLWVVSVCGAQDQAREQQVDQTLVTGRWYAFLATPGGRLPFHLDIAGEPGAYTAHVINADERVEIPIVKIDGDQLTLEFDYFDSRIIAGIYDDGTALHGIWSKTRGAGNVAQIKFWAYRNDQPRFTMPPTRSLGKAASTLIDGRWRVDFADSDEPAIAQFQVDDQGIIKGTFLTSTGDYRYLEGVYTGKGIKLSTFDGGHAFLFQAQFSSREKAIPVDEQDVREQTLTGMFWSGDWHSEAWFAVRDISITLADPRMSVQVSRIVDMDAIRLPDPAGIEHTVAQLTEGGRCIIIEIMGTWCPNCKDASVFLSSLHEEYADQGLRIVSLAFELTGDELRDRQQIQIYIDRMHLPFPVLYAGQADKATASASLPFIERVKAYPTFIVLNEFGGVVMTYSGFNGPATGQKHIEMRRNFVRIIRDVLRVN